MMAEPEMIWQTNARKPCFVGDKMFAEHKIVEGIFNGRVRHNCPRCGMWLEPAIVENSA